MALYAWIIALAAFLSVIAAIVFTMLVVGIHKRDRTRRLYDAPETVWTLSPAASWASASATATAKRTEPAHPLPPGEIAMPVNPKRARK